MEMQEIIERSPSETGYILPDVIDSNYGLLDLSEFGMKVIPIWGRSTCNPVRRATLQIDRISSPNGFQYLGRIFLQGVSIHFINNSGMSTQEIENKFFPQLEYYYSLILKHRVTDEDKEKNDHYSVGELTDQFGKIWDVVSFAQIVFNTRLKGSWELFVHYAWGGIQKLLEI